MSKIIDLTGQRFGILTAQYHTYHNGRSAWHCLCDCGTEKDIDANNLRSGKVQSCGCQRNKTISQKNIKDITNQKFNHLTVLEATDKRSCGAVVWKCLCDCGNIVEVSTGNLKSGHTKTCGKCVYTFENHHLDLIGKQFGHLTVIDFYDIKNQESRWKCKCDCGNECIAVGWLLNSGEKLSCGCIKSFGEQKITQLLTQNNIYFEREKTFESCRFPDTKRLARFDFWVNNSYLIEYDGKQHFIEEGTGYMTKERLIKIKEHDIFKNQWCQNNNIPIIRISYLDIDNITIQDLLYNRKE